MAQFPMSPCENAQSHVRHDALHMPPDCMSTSANHAYLDQVAIVRTGRQQMNAKRFDGRRLHLQVMRTFKVMRATAMQQNPPLAMRGA